MPKFISSIFVKIKIATNSNSLKVKIIFIIASLLVAMLGGKIWSDVGTKLLVEMSLIALLIGFLNGVVGLLFRRDDSEWFYALVSAFFSFMGYLFGKYLLINFWINNSTEIIKFESFFDTYLNYFDLYDFLWICLVVLISISVSFMSYRKIDPNYTIMTEYK